ncbi:kinesin-like protein KIN-12B [Physcomitrium patens]|uniref:Kinesin motor domain-containing protein n=1 Tax=Physcomitrium patens TaxID=3218 RepID=A0A2K1KC93_PHYPA|nr:kinesin-like protein KIN-12A [Physcomitrium patens]PNR51392.1 hypothetical protein PHYPA_010579 [Physcomitrium patens]|eukprot:XP_024379513.1 kinesin-like protein KIN-12A [Physcomitrella patens]
MRPLNKKEAAEEATNVVQKLSGDSLSLGDQQFTFDSVAGETESQEAVFEMVGRPMVENCLAGFNSSIFAYGQTGSGKTHTMWGILPTSGTDASVTEERGITPRVFEQLFSRIQQEERNNVEKQLRYQCRCSFLEIYNEQITDLLEPTQKNLLIREDTKTGVYVEGLTEEYVSNMDDVISLLVRGSANRRVGSTAMNNESSRSHSVFTFVIESRSKSVAEGVSSVRTSRMNLVDLAGSERQKQTGAAGDRLKEAGNINKSLSQLGNVINILAEVAQSGKHRHIPYRSSRLTFLLQESLGGNAKLAMICAISPASSCRTETLSTLRFAQRAKAIQNKAVVNEELGNDVNLLREQIRQLKDELMRMKCNSIQTEGSAGGLSSGWNARRSYNLLRLSLGQPMTIAPNEIKETDMPLEEKIGEDEFFDANAGDKLLASDVDVETKELLTKAELNTGKFPDPNEKSQAADGSVVGDGNGPELAAQRELPELTLSLVAPTMSVSPRVKEGKKEEFGVDISFGLPKSPLGLRSSKAFSSSTGQLAASLTRGVEILENQRRQSRRFSGARFSFQNGESPSSPKCESPVLARVNSIGINPLSQGTRDVVFASEKENTFITTNGIKLGSPSPGELSPLPEITQEDWKLVPSTPPAQMNNAQDVSALLAGALRREKIAEETIAQQAADLEQLTRLVRQYKQEREYNAVIQQSREEKIVRMESLMDGILPSKDYCTDELAALQLENKMLQEKFIHHPELAEAKAEQELLRHELNRYKALCDLEASEKLQQEIVQLRNQVLLYLENGTPGSMKQRRLSLTPTKGIQPSYSPIKLMSLTAVPEAMPSCESASSSRQLDDEPPASTTEGRAAEFLEQERAEWDEREKELVAMVQGLREECDHYMMLAEKRRKELEGEKRCTQEMHEALQMAMTGHARILDQYAELQEKHILLLSNMREIRHGVIEYKKEAKNSGMNCVEDHWFDVQATQITYFKVEQERFKEQIRQLQSQLDDTADAVQAAGELVVRLKESERAATLAKHTAAVAEEEADELRRELKKSNRRHFKEIASLQQRLHQSSSRDLAHLGDDGDNVQAETAIIPHVMKQDPGVSESLSGDTTISEFSDDGTCVYENWDVGATNHRSDAHDSAFEDHDHDIVRESVRFSRDQYQNLKNLEINFEDDDGFFCEQCGQQTTNSMRVCDSCI